MFFLILDMPKTVIKVKKKSSPQSLFILKISNFVCFFPKISDIIYELGNWRVKILEFFFNFSSFEQDWGWLIDLCKKNLKKIFIRYIFIAV